GAKRRFGRSGGALAAGDTYTVPRSSRYAFWITSHSTQLSRTAPMGGGERKLPAQTDCTKYTLISRFIALSGRYQAEARGRKRPALERRRPRQTESTSVNKDAQARIRTSVEGH